MAPDLTHPLGRLDQGTASPLSSGQQQMWVLHQLDPAAPAYLMSWSMSLTGALSVDSLRRAWERIIERHDVLRTRYQHSDDGAIQVIDPPGPFDLPLIDLSGHEPAAARGQARQLAEQMRRTPMDLTIDHPIRVRLLKLETEVHWCVITIHHIACDENSYRRIGEELSILYAHYATGAPASLPEPSLRYTDYARRERERRSADELRPQLDYWRRRLSGLTDLALPADRPRPARPDMRGGALEILVPPDTAAAVQRLAEERRATPAIVLLALFQAMLAQVSGQTDIAVGLPVSARVRPDLDQLVGYLVNTVVVRSHCDADRSFLHLLEEVRTHALDALDRRDVPFAWVVDELSPTRRGGANPLFQVAFDMNRSQHGAISLAGLKIEHLGLQTDPVAKFDLNLHVEESEEAQPHIYLEYAVALFDQETARGFASAFEFLMNTAVFEPHTPLADIWQRFGPVREPRRPAGGHGRTEQHSPATAGTAWYDDMRRQVEAAWLATLKRDRVGSEENFFDTGGDSLLAVSLAARLRSEGLDVTAADVLTHQTIDELTLAVADRVGIATGTAGVAPFALVSQSDRDRLPTDAVDAYPCAMAQLGMIIEMRARPDLARYQDTTSFLIRDERGLDLAALRAAAQLLVDRHEILRTSFDLSSYSTPLQVVHASADIRPGLTEHGPVEFKDWEPMLQAYAAEQRRVLFDLARPPLLRIHAHTSSSSTDWWLSLTECHPTVEGWSFHLLLMDLLTSYHAIRDGKAPPESQPFPFRYADHIAAEAAALESESDRAYWRQVHRDRVPATLPSVWHGDRDAPEERYQHTVLYLDLEERLRELARETRTSLKAVLLAAHLKVMNMVAGTDRFFTGLVCDARPEMVGAEHVAGMYLNTLSISMPEGARTWGELVTSVHDRLAEMWPHRRLPMQAIQHEYGNHDRLLEVMFNYLDFHHVDKRLLEWTATVTETDNEFALHVFTTSGVVKLNTTTHVLSRKNAERLGALYRRVLEEMSEGAAGDAAASCLPADELTNLRAVTATPSTDRRPTTFLELFEACVRDHPDAVATVDASASLTYRELDRAADRLADRIRQTGAGPGSLVALAVTPDHRLPLAVLAVSKVDAAWVHVRPDDVVPLHHVMVTDAPETAGAPDGVSVVHTGGAVPGRGLAGASCVLPIDATSGVVVSRSSLAQALAGMTAALTEHGVKIGPGVEWGLMSPPTSWAALGEIMLPLATGGGLVVGGTTPIRCRDLRSVSTAPPGADNRLVACGLPQTAGWVAAGGRPLPGVTVRVLDSRQGMVPIGAIGELCLGGTVLATGYLDDPARTAEKFVPDPHGPPGARMVRTGLLARWHEAGTLEHLGPRAALTAANGQFLDLAQVQQELRRLPGTRETSVVLQGADRRIVGYVRADDGVTLDTQELRRKASGRLPRRLALDAVVQVEHWPLTPTGELDTDALPPPEAAREPRSAGKPWDEQFEALLRGVLRFLPEEEDLRSDLELAEFGLDSLGTVELLTSLEAAYDIEMSDELLAFETFATAGSLWQQIDRLRADRPAQEAAARAHGHD
ncbi:condensation domain-containing protein [Nonomuraea sp. NPDC052265]|uniref:condensation domain-containing protein n=1 Tax=Nonomuraea sp. NPDC052265 TaxID=3364374 RepID=UPI0037C9BDE9